MRMRSDLLYYYERELSYLRRMGAEFAAAYPKVAARLQIEPTKCEDPHVERLLEGFAFLAARVHRRLEDDFSLISEALLNVVAPHYVRPIPSMSIVECEMDPEQSALLHGLPLPRGTPLMTRPVGGLPCHFRTCYDTTLWPFEVTDAAWTSPGQLTPALSAPDAAAAIRVELQSPPDTTFAQYELSSLRLHLAGENSLTHSLYELVFSRCLRVVVREVGVKNPRSCTLPASAVEPVGFAEDEGMLPFSRRSFLGYRLLQEYFVFPEKFLFVDVKGLEAVRELGFGRRLEIVFLIAPFERAERRPALESGVNRRTFRLGCTPVVNLFSQTAEPILLTQRRHEYLLIPDARRRDSIETYSVDEVVGVTPGIPDPVRFEPMYSHRHGRDSAAPEIFWSMTRRPSGFRGERADEVFLSFSDLSSRTVYPEQDVVTARLTCFNGNLPNRLPIGLGENDFELAGGAPVQRIRALVKPTPVHPAPLGDPLLWRLISQLSLNYLSLIDGGPAALQEILRLHNASGREAGERQIDAILRVESGPGYARVTGEHGLSFARGRRIEMELDEEHFTGGGVFLFASVLERFFAMYASLNSFTALSVRTKQRQRKLHEWPARAGWKPLL
ncbi:MAG TPA: type VI secretion system baseplate subunit TssF [Longimicrobiaceae bacterium]|nr:type VI secretion system baseplate subunit TssF [Longimicrobiaceae bacterium]